MVSKLLLKGNLLQDASLAGYANRAGNSQVSILMQPHHQIIVLCATISTHTDSGYSVCVCVCDVICCIPSSAVQTSYM